MTFASIDKALEDIRQGRMVILVDDEDRENEGDLCMAADCITPEAINFMARYGRGLICLTMTGDKLRQLDIPMMVEDNTSSFETAFTVSIEARHGVTTGISAADRATTIRAAIADDAKPSDLVRPGHIFPLRAKDGGVLVRTGQTEGAIDLARLAGHQPAGVICEIMNDDGSMARLPDLERFAAEHDLALISIEQLIQYRLAHESLVDCLLSQHIVHPVCGDVTVHVYQSKTDGRQHLAVVKGDLKNNAGKAPLVRVHAGYPCTGIFGDLFGADRAMLDSTLERLAKEDRGVLVCIDRDSCERSLVERVADLGKTPTASNKESREGREAVVRQLGTGAQILRHLGLSRLRILSNNAKQYKGLSGYGLHVEEVEPLAQDIPTIALPTEDSTPRAKAS